MDLGYSQRKIETMLLFFAFLLSFSSTVKASAEKVSIQLDWKYQYEFAGFIMAKEKGYYQDVGLDVELIEYKSGTDTVDLVLSQQANYGLYNSSVVVHNRKIKPTILLATYFQKSPLVLVTSKDIKHPKDLVGKRISATKDELKYSSLALMLNHFYVNEKNTKFQQHAFNIEDFIEHKVDAMSAFRTNQLFLLDELGIEYNVLDPAEYGFSMSAANLFTSPEEALNYPERTARFIEASNKGWKYALAHGDETIAIIHNKYAMNKSIEALQFEAEVSKKMMLLDFFEIGETNEELSRRTVKQLHFSGLLDEGEKLGEFVFTDFITKFGTNLQFSEQQNLYLKGKKEITFCVDPNWMPFEGIRDGNYIGISADIISQFESKLPIPMRLESTKHWTESLLKAQARQCDILTLAMETKERLSYLNFTRPYLSLPTVMATRTDTIFMDNIAAVKNRKVGIVKGYAVIDIARNEYPEINIIEVDSVRDGLARVENGELFGYIDNLMVIANSIQTEFTGELKISLRLEEETNLSIATRNDEPLLNEIFNILVSNIKEEDLQQIYNKWVSVSQEPVFDYRLAWQLFTIIILLTFVYVYHYLKFKTLNNELLRLSTTDALTGIFNRLKLDELLAQEKYSVDRYGTVASVISLDIDYFKKVNDQYGHLTGDKVLVEFAQVLKDNVRQTDHVGRWGGEEFFIICPNIDVDEAAQLAEKLLVKISNYSFSEIKSLTASAGVSPIIKTWSVTVITNNVDKALYQSKENGRNQVTVVSGS